MTRVVNSQVRRYPLSDQLQVRSSLVAMSWARDWDMIALGGTRKCQVYKSSIVMAGKGLAGIE